MDIFPTPFSEAALARVRFLHREYVAHAQRSAEPEPIIVGFFLSRAETTPAMWWVFCGAWPLAEVEARWREYVYWLPGLDAPILVEPPFIARGGRIDLVEHDQLVLLDARDVPDAPAGPPKPDYSPPPEPANDNAPVTG